jgi:transposase-like protein
MRAQIVAHHAQGGAGLSDVARQAVAVLAADAVAR